MTVVDNRYVRLRMVLTGKFAGQSGVINGCEFVKGVHTMVGPLGSFEHRIRVLGYYGAFLEGSDELKAAQELTNGRSDNPVSPGQEDNSGVHADESAASEASERGGHAGSEAGEVGVLSEGTGTEAGRSLADEQRAKDNNYRQTKIRQIVESLDPDVEENWTQAGLPRLSTVEIAMDETGILRGEIEAASPGLTRDKARELKEVASL